MTLISKTTYTFTVLHRTDEPIMGDDDFDGPFGGDLGAALQRSWDGNAVGAIVEEFTVEVPDERVPAELVALGNDGEFFIDDLHPLDVKYEVVSDNHSNHNLHIGATVEFLERRDEVDLYTQGGEGDEVAIDRRDLKKKIEGHDIAADLARQSDFYAENDRTIPAGPDHTEDPSYTRGAQRVPTKTEE